MKNQKTETPTNLSNPRRQFLTHAAWIAGVGLALSTLTAKAAPRSCASTPTQPKGPFFPTGREPLTGFTKDTDLTVIEGGTAIAAGQVIELSGHLFDEACNPIEGATIEIWQACATGRYNHENDPNPAELDPNFQYYGKAKTDVDGRYSFRTVIPGAYPAGTNPDGTEWVRPPHIHFRVMKLGYLELMSQMYFAGETLNDHDLILQSLPESERDGLIVKLDAHPTQASVKTAVFDLSLRKPRRR